MGGFFGTISTKSCVNDLFYGTDYNSHLGTRRAGMVMYDKEKGSVVRFIIWSATISVQNLKTNSIRSLEIRVSASSVIQILSQSSLTLT